MNKLLPVLAILPLALLLIFGLLYLFVHDPYFLTFLGSIVMMLPVLFLFIWGVHKL